MACGGSLAQTTRPAELMRQQAEAKKQHDQMMNNIKLVPGTFKMEDVCQITQENGKIMLKTKLPDTLDRNGQSRIKVEGLSDNTIVTIFGRNNKNLPQNFSLNNTNFSDLQAIQVDTTIQWNAQNFSITRMSRLPTGFKSISLSQGQYMFTGGQMMQTGVQFVVNESDNLGQMPVNVTCAATDFGAMRRQNPREVDRYLRPILREMHMEALMAVDPILAWQVFADEWQPQAQLQADIDRLLPALDAEGFQQREEAVKQLKAKGRDMALVAYHLNRKALTPQQNMELDTFLAGFQTVAADEAGRMKGDKQFLLDCLYSVDEQIRAAALKHLQEVWPGKLAFDVGADSEKRMAAIDTLRAESLKAATQPAAQ